MVLYECKCCNYKTKLKTDFSRHLKTKKHARNSDLEFDVLKETTLKTQKDPKKTQKDPKKTQKDPKKTQCDKKPYKCEFCDDTFSTHPNKRKHELHRCKLRFGNEGNKFKDHYIKLLEKEKSKLYNQIDALIEKAGDTTNNTINLNNYGDEDLSHITDKFKTQLLKGPYTMIPKMIEAVHFNDAKPENKNITMTNKKEKHIRVLKNGEWGFFLKKEIINDVINNNYYILDTHYDENGKELLSEIQRIQYEKFQKEMDNGKLDKATHDEINLICMNNGLKTGLS